MTTCGIQNSLLDVFISSNARNTFDPQTVVLVLAYAGKFIDMEFRWLESYTARADDLFYHFHQISFSLA